MTAFSRGNVRSPAQAFRRLDTLDFSTVTEVKNSTKLKVGDIVRLHERGGAAFDVELTSNVTPNDKEVIQMTFDPTLSIVLRESILTNLEEFGGTTLSDKIKNAMDFVRSGASLVPYTILVPPKKGGGAYDWDSVVDLSDDSWVTLKSAGIVSVKATASIDAFVKLGISNKNNETVVSGFSFDCFNQNMDAAIMCGSMRGVDISRIETKATGAGSFVDGILVGGDDKHTGTEFGAGNEQSTIKHLFDSGDSAVSRSMIYFSGGTSLGFVVDNVRATREKFVDVIGSAANSGFNGCLFQNIHANFLTERVIKANSIVNLKRNVTSTTVKNIGATSNPNQNNVNYGLLVDGLDASISSSLHTENTGLGYIIKDVSYPAAVIRTHINGTSFNNGDPNSQGVMNNTAYKESGGLVWDETNKTLFVGGKEGSPNEYETPLLKRRVSIANNGIYKLTLPVGDYRLGGTIISVVSDMTAGVVREGIASLRASGTASASKLTNGANFSVLTGALSGTTGTVGHVTVSADSADGSIYIENRTGAARNFMITFLS